MTRKMGGNALALTILLFSVVSAAAQTYTQMQWGVNKSVTPYAFGANINGTWRNLGTVSAAGAWSIPTSNLSFTQLGTGAINQTVDAKLKSLWVSITDFCTDAQIASDITSCAQAAIDSVAPSVVSYGGGTVYFPSRKSFYNLTGTLYLNKSFVNLVGDSPQGSYVNCVNGAADCIVIGSLTSPTRNQSIEKIAINGNGLKTGGSNIKLQGDLFNVKLDRVQLENCIRCVDIGPGNNSTTIRDSVLIPNQAASDYGIYWHAPGDGSARNDVLVLSNVTISGQWSNATGIMWEGLSATLEASHLRILHANYGMRIVNPAASASHYPQFLNGFDMQFEGFKTRALSIEAGTSYKIEGSDLNNLSGGLPAQGNADDDAVRILSDATASITRNVVITNSRLGGSRQSGLNTNARDVQLSNVSFYTTSYAGSGLYPVIKVGPDADDSIFSNIKCEEFGGAARASYCIDIDAGAVGVTASLINARYVNTAAILDNSGNGTAFTAITDPNGTTWSKAGQSLQVGPQAPDVNSFALFRKDQNNASAVKVANVNTGASASARFDQATGTSNSFCINSLNDNAGSPFWSFACGSAVNYAQWDVPLRLGSTIRLKGYTVSTLPTCDATAEGSMAYVTDATAPTYDGALTGGGAVKVPVFCNGAAWRSH